MDFVLVKKTEGVIWHILS